MILRKFTSLKKWAMASGSSVLPSKRFDVGFICSHPVDEVWVRSTALECVRRGLTVELVVCGGAISDCVKRTYSDKRVSVSCYPELSALPKGSYGALITASSGLDRSMFRSNAKYFVHMPHSLCSLHMIYPEDAFKGYDALFACGPHHEREFAALSKKLGVDPKECFPIGYGKLDILAASMVRAKEPVSVNKRKCVLIAPSWGGGNLIDSFGTDLCELLLDDGLEVVVRPHPMFFMEERAELKDFVQLQKNHPFFKLENPMSSDGEAILRADVLVGDYSGVSLEFAALRRMPVVSVNVPPKVVNRHWEEIGIEPIELKIRESIGVLVDSDLTAVSEAVSSIVSAPKIERTSQADISSFLYGGTGSCSLEAFNALSSLLGGEL